MENDSGSSERTKRSGPTIDLDPSEVTVNQNAAGTEAHEPASDATDNPPDQNGRKEDARDRAAWEPSPRRWFDNASNALTPALSGATAAALILVGAWLLGLSGDNRTSSVPMAADGAATADLTARLAQLEAKVAAALSAPAPVSAADPALTRRIDQTDASIRSVTGALAALRADLDKVVAAAKDAPPAQRDAQAPAFDSAPLEQRMSQIETAQQAVTQAMRQAARPYDDAPLRRAQIASALDGAVRSGEPFAEILASAKTISPAASLQPLDAFAAGGVPNDTALSRELMALLPQLSPAQPKQAAATSGAGGVFDRLQESAARLVKVERVDQASAEPPASAAKAAAAARNGDVNAAKAALMDLPAAQRAPAQGWLDRLQARDAARDAARQFAAAQNTALPAR